MQNCGSQRHSFPRILIPRIKRLTNTCLLEWNESTTADYPCGYYVAAVADSWQNIRTAPWITTITGSAAKCKNQQVSLLPTHLYQAKILDKTNIVSQREQQRLKPWLVTKISTGDSFALLFLASTNTSWVRRDEHKATQNPTLCVIALYWQWCHRADLWARADQHISWHVVKDFFCMSTSQEGVHSHKGTEHPATCPSSVKTDPKEIVYVETSRTYESYSVWQ